MKNPILKKKKAIFDKHLSIFGDSINRHIKEVTQDELSDLQAEIIVKMRQWTKHKRLYEDQDAGHAVDRDNI